MDIGSLREDERFEAKRCDNRLPNSFWPTYSAFANTFGGRIVLGLTEDSKDRRRLTATGVADPEKIVQDIWDQANNPQKVSVNILSDDDVRIEECEGVRVVVVDVPRAERQKRPVYINGSVNSGTYRRNGEGDYHCSIHEVAEMLRDSREEPLDSTLCTRVLLRDLDAKSVESYRNMMSSRNPGHPWNAEPNDEFLRLIGAADDDGTGNLRPTIAGVLMFGRDYSIVRELPRYMLDYLEYPDGGDEWTDRLCTDTGDWAGNLLGFYMHVSNRIGINGRRPFSLDGMVRTDDTELLKAEREAVLNGIVHADYNGSGGVRVELRPSSLVVRNPGTFRIPIRLAESGGHTDPRNPNVMRMFMLVGLVERAGSGVHRMVRACRELGLDDPRIEEGMDPATVTVAMDIFAEPKAAGKPTNADILDFIERDPGISIADLAQATGLSTSTVSRRIRDLKDSGLLVREGDRRDGRWRVVRRRPGTRSDTRTGHVAGNPPADGPGGHRVERQEDEQTHRRRQDHHGHESGRRSHAHDLR